MEEGLARYTDLYEFAPVGYLTIDRDGGIRQVNLAGARLLGLERARLIGGSLFVHSEISGGTTIEVRAPVVAPGVGSVSETSERTPMADEADLAAWSPEPDDLVGAAGVRSVRPGASSGPDTAPKGVRP